LDLGGGYVKVGLGEKRLQVPNCTAALKKSNSILVGDQTAVEDGSLRHSDLTYSRPFERGYLTNPDNEIEVLERIFKDILRVNPSAPNIAGVALTEAPFAPSESKAYLDEIVFEHFGFKSLVKQNAATVAAFAHCSVTGKENSYSSSAYLMVDFGYSFTLVTPVLCGSPVEAATKRLDIGGKLLTNYLKELVSYRQFNLIDDTHVIEMARRKVCYASLNFQADLQRSVSQPRKASLDIRLKYALPNYHNVLEGYIIPLEAEKSDLSDLQVLEFCSERFVVPELYFHPSDVGLNQAGVHEVIEHSISLCPVEVQDILRQNIVVTGGNSQTKNMVARLSRELGPRYIVKRIQTKHKEENDSIMAPLVGLLDPKSQTNILSKQEYEEQGPYRQ